MPKNEWENADLDFFRAFYSVIKKLAQLFFSTKLAFFHTFRAETLESPSKILKKSADHS